MNHDKYEMVIGLEVHTQLLTKSKLFSGDSTSFGAAPNTHVSPVSLAHPGTLPVMNKEVISLAVKLGIAMHCDINQHSYFTRKSYFYPDLPKGYQVTQHTAPVCKGGYLSVQTASGRKNVKLNRIHIEEDAGKSIHNTDENFTCIDLNRAGTPLLEIVTEPDLHSAEEVHIYLTELRRLVRWLDVCDGNMEEGSLRCDANISVRRKGETKLGTRVEIKNLNSIRNVKKAIELEAARLISITEKGETIKQETRSFDAEKNISFSLRSKEKADDYRYFPEPDLPPFNITENYISSIRKTMPALPASLEEKYMKEYNLSAYDAAAICIDKDDAALYDTVSEKIADHKSVANWVTGPVRNYCIENNIGIKEFPLPADKLADLIAFSNSRKIHFNIASSGLMEAFINNKNTSPETLAVSMNLLQENNSDILNRWVDETIASMPDKVKEYRSGKKGLIALFVGQVKKLSKGKADMQSVKEMLEEKLK